MPSNSFKIVLDTKIDIDKIHRPKRAKITQCAKQEVKLILNAHNNLKHKTMLSLIYSCGLRCGRIISIATVHIDSKRNLVLLKKQKVKRSHYPIIA
jgi:integrase/recombinase XerD